MFRVNFSVFFTETYLANSYSEGITRIMSIPFKFRLKPGEDRRCIKAAPIIESTLGCVVKTLQGLKL